MKYFNLSWLLKKYICLTLTEHSRIEAGFISDCLFNLKNKVGTVSYRGINIWVFKSTGLYNKLDRYCCHGQQSVENVNQQIFISTNTFIIFYWILRGVNCEVGVCWMHWQLLSGNLLNGRIIPNVTTYADRKFHESLEESTGNC